MYLGQSQHLAYRPHRYDEKKAPQNFYSIRDKWTGLCSYTAKANKNKALCSE